MRSTTTRRRARSTTHAACIAVLALTVGACSGGSSSGDQSAPKSDALSKADKAVTVSFWHAMNGTNATVLTGLVDAFNKAHTGKITVKATYAGTYDDAITKYKAAIKSKTTPDVIQIYDIGTRFMIDAKQTVPMQDFIDRDKTDVKDLQPNIAGYYSVDSKLYSMPFNTSMPVLYYNKTMFTKAGLDPNKPPATLEEIRADAEKLVKAKGGPADYGFGAAIYGWLLEQFIANSGDDYCDSDNGRKGTATKVLFDQPDPVAVVAWWQKMVSDKLAANTGRDTAAAQTAFKSQQVAMVLESTGQVSGFSKAAADGGFELGVANYPKLKVNESGPIIGGASLWINGVGHEDANKEASWEFVKYLAQADTQAAWHTGTGYFPISKGALTQPADVAWLQRYPQFNVAVQQLQGTPLTTHTQGCLMGVMPQARKAAEDGIESALNGTDPQQAMTKAAAGLAAQISTYNSSVK